MRSKFSHPVLLIVLCLSFVFIGCGGSGGGSSGDGGTSTPEPTAVPAAPTNVNCVPSDDSITVTWDHVTNATSYNIYYASSPGVTPSGYAALPDVTKITNVTSPYVLSGLTNGTTYYLIVTALNSTGESKSSIEQSATPLPVPAAPIGLSGVTAKDEVTLTWDAVPVASSYNLYFATEQGVTASNYSTLTDGNKIADVTSPYVVSGLDNESQYYFVVTAENALGESIESLELSAVPGSKGWFWQNPTPAGNQLRGVDFIDQTTGWAVGSGGTILHTNDGGTIWTEQWSGATIDFYDVSAVDSSNVWVVGWRGSWVGDNGNVIISSTDGGATWTSYAMPSMTSGLSGVDFITATTGWVVGREGIYHTTDGGKSWVLQKNASYVNKVKFVDTNHGWAVAGSGTSGTIYRTSDGGTTWISDSFGKGASDVDFVDSSKGWIVEYISTGGIYATSNGGTTWGPQPTPANYLRSIAFGDANTGWAVGNFGKIVNTTNGGGSWAAQTSGVSAHLNAVAALDASFAWIVGDGGKILHTSNGGATWNRQNSDPITSSGFSSVDFVSSTTGWVVGRSIVQTTDGGTTWTVQVSGLTGGMGSDIDFVDSLNGWAVASGSQILHTADGGTTWTNQNSNGASQLLGVSFINATTGWTVGCGGAIRYTADGGTTWFPQISGITSCLEDVAFVDSSNGWAVGQGGIILHTTDGGNSWLGQLSGTTNDLRAVFALDSYTAWTVGGNSSGSPAIIRKTTNGGATWVTLSNGENGWLNTIFFTDALNGWTGGPNGMIFATQDGGTTWTRQSSSVGGPHSINGFSFINATTGWAVGGAGEGTILKTDTGGVGP
jgi:photosystem II stability/assembly factor-like uncharacterized protein